MSHTGSPLALSPCVRERVKASSKLAALLDCFRIVDPESLRQLKSYQTDKWKNKIFKLICSTAKGAGGTGKTTFAVTQACAQVLEGHNSLLINADSQASCEERVLGKMLHEFYDGNWDEFLIQNNMTPFGIEGGAADQVPSNLKDSLQTMFRTNGAWRARIMPPKVIAVDFTRMSSVNYADKSNTARLYVMLAHEEIAIWDQRLSESRVWMQFPGVGGMHKAAFGAFYALCKICAYVFHCGYVFVDMGPGSGIFNRNILCSSHGIFLPLTIEGKSESTIASLGQKLTVWVSEWQNLAALANTAENQYHIPMHRPKLLGVVFTRLGARGAVRPSNQLLQLLRCYDRIDNILMPAAVATGMALTPQQYTACTEAVMQVLQKANVQALNAVPPAHKGVVGMLPDFDTLAHMAERECVPVPFLLRHHFLTINNLNAVDMAAPPNEEDYLVPVAHATAQNLEAKVANIKDMVDIFVNLVCNLEDEVQQAEVQPGVAVVEASVAPAEPMDQL